jgi:hypothetical protein
MWPVWALDMYRTLPFRPYEPIVPRGAARPSATPSMWLCLTGDGSKRVDSPLDREGRGVLDLHRITAGLNKMYLLLPLQLLVFADHFRLLSAL